MRLQCIIFHVHRAFDYSPPLRFSEYIWLDTKVCEDKHLGCVLNSYGTDGCSCCWRRWIWSWYNFECFVFILKEWLLTSGETIFTIINKTVVLPLLILLTIVLVLLWCPVDRLWDLLLMVTLLFLVVVALPVDLRSSSFDLDTFCKALKNTSIWFSILTTEHALLSLYHIL